MMKKRKNIVSLLFSATAMAAGSAMLGVSSPALAQPAQCDADEGGPSQTLSPRIGQEVQTLYEFMQNDQFNEALAGLNTLLNNRGDSMNAYERATVLELRASTKVNLEDYRGALSDMQAALNANGLPPARNNQLRYFIAQLYFQLEQYQNAINGLNQWIQTARTCGVAVDTNAYYLLAAAYASVTPPNYAAAERPIEQALEGMSEPRKGYYDLANLVYSELNRSTKRTDLLERMVNLWPNEASYWRQLSGAYNNSGRDREAFSVLEVAYRAGLITEENELIQLVQYYSFFENPYRGAVLLEREMNAGNIDRDQDNLVLLSQLWSQSREHKRSIPILREAAQNSGDGELFYRLGMVLLADEQYAASQTALESALNRGGMDRRETGDAWLLLGTARFSQAGPSDTAVWARAREAFVRAQAYDNARRRASDWIAYIDAVVSTYWDGLRLEYQQAQADCQDDFARFDRDARIRELRAEQPDPAALQREAARRAQCDALTEGGAPNRSTNSIGGLEAYRAQEPGNR